MDANPRLEPVWDSMAEHFLDTETRYAVPRTASCCLQAGLTIAEAADVWRFEVTPVLWPNLWDVAGEWAGWPTDWLVCECGRQRVARSSQPGFGARWLYRARIGVSHGVWLAIAKTMALLLAHPESGRVRVSEELVDVARHYFDFVPRPVDDVATLRARFVEIRPVLAGLVVCNASESVEGCEARVLAAIGCPPSAQHGARAG